MKNQNGGNQIASASSTGLTAFETLHNSGSPSYSSLGGGSGGASLLPFPLAVSPQKSGGANQNTAPSRQEAVQSPVPQPPTDEEVDLSWILSREPLLEQLRRIMLLRVQRWKHRSWPIAGLQMK